MGGLLILLAVISRDAALDGPVQPVRLDRAGDARRRSAPSGSRTTTSSSTRRRSLGLTGRGKLVPQFLVALAVGVRDRAAGRGTARSRRVITFPFLKKLLLDLGVLYIPFVALVVVGLVQRRQPDRRPGRPGDRRGRHRGGDLRAARLRHGQRASPPATCRSRSSRRRASSRSSAARWWARRLGFLWFNCHPGRRLHGRRRRAAARRARSPRSPS